MLLLELELSSKYVYHVTFSKNVAGIKKKGLVPLQTSNWTKGDGERYNKDGGVFAFEHPIDAFKWAFNMNWEFKKPISIIRFRSSDHWEKDPSADIMLRMGKGKALVSTGTIPPKLFVDAIDFDSFSNPNELGISQQEWMQQIEDKLTASERHND